MPCELSLELTPNPNDADAIWNMIMDVIKGTLENCPTAKIQIDGGSDGGPIGVTLTVADKATAMLVKLRLKHMPWRWDEV